MVLFVVVNSCGALEACDDLVDRMSLSFIKIIGVGELCCMNLGGECLIFDSELLL